MRRGVKALVRDSQRRPQASSRVSDVFIEPRQNTTAKWTAIVLAGERPGVDPLAKHFGLASKAMVPVCGQPMLGWALRALLSVPAVGRIVVLAQRADALLGAGLAWTAAESSIKTASSGRSISESLHGIVGKADAPWPVLVTTADHPLLTREMIETFLSRAAESEIAVGVVERKTVVASYPESVRTWLKFSDGAFSGANLFALKGANASRALKLWASAEQDRKHQAKLFWHFGPWLAFRAATRTIGFDAALRRAGRNLDICAAAVQLPFAEAAIDVDKVSDHQIVEQIMRRRRAPPAREPGGRRDRASVRDWAAIERCFAPQVTVDYTSLWGGDAERMASGDLVAQWRAMVPGFDATRLALGDVTITIHADHASGSAPTIPLIAIQLQALRVGEHLTLHFTTVLDELTRGLVDEDEDAEAAPADRAYWEKKATKETVAIADELLKMSKEFEQGLELKYNRFYIGLNRHGQAFNFAIFRPQKNHLQLGLRLPETQKLSDKIEAAGLETQDYDRSTSAYRIRLNRKDLAGSKAHVVSELLQLAHPTKGIVKERGDLPT